MLSLHAKTFCFDLWNTIRKKPTENERKSKLKKTVQKSDIKCPYPHIHQPNIYET